MRRLGGNLARDVAMYGASSMARNLQSLSYSMANDSAPLSMLAATRTQVEAAGRHHAVAVGSPALDRPRVLQPGSVGAIVHAVLIEHRTLLVLSLAYIGVGGAVLISLGRPWPIRLISPWFVGIWGVASGVWLTWQYLRSPRHLQAALEPTRVAGAALVALLVLPTQITFQALKQSIGHVIGFRFDTLFHRVDVALHGSMPWLWFGPVLRRPFWVQLLDLLYMFWFVGLIGFVLWAGWTRFRRVRQRALVAVLLLWIMGGTLAALFAASAGPVYYANVVGAASPYATLISQLDAITTFHGPLFARVGQRGLWDLYATDGWGAMAGISAMPSLHVALAVLFALVAGKCSRRWAVMLWAYAILIQAGSVVLGWHYAIDGYAGALIALGCWIGAGHLCHPDVRFSPVHKADFR